MAMQDTHGQSGSGWYGFDLDGTLAKYDGWKGIDHIGAPVKPMVDLIKRMHTEGKVVKILTARVAPRSAVEYKYRDKCTPPEYTEKADFSCFPVNAKTWIKNMYLGLDTWGAREFIIDWCLKNLGFLPEITHEKDHLMLECYDDRVKQVIPNEGVLVEALADRAVSEYDRVKADLGWALNRANCRFISFASGVLISSVVYSLAHLGISTWRDSFADRTPASEALRAARESLSVLSERLDDLERGGARDWGFVPSDVLSVRDGGASVGRKN